MRNVKKMLKVYCGLSQLLNWRIWAKLNRLRFYLFYEEVLSWVVEGWGGSILRQNIPNSLLIIDRSKQSSLPKSLNYFLVSFSTIQQTFQKPFTSSFNEILDSVAKIINHNLFKNEKKTRNETRKSNNDYDLQFSSFSFKSPSN